jgi:predicted nucleic acid-binding protein
VSILADTNILLRRTQPNHPHHAAAVESVAKLLDRDETVYFTMQNISEFWNCEVEKIERFLTFLPDAPLAYSEWKRLLVTHGVLGVKVHDAKLVAAMNVHGIRWILTFNTQDFARYAIETIHPDSLLSAMRRGGVVLILPKVLGFDRKQIVFDKYDQVWEASENCVILTTRPSGKTAWISRSAPTA